MSDKTKPHFGDWERFQTNGDEIMGALGSTATAYFVSSVQVLTARETGWTACTGGTVNKAGLNATFVTGTVDTTSVTTISTSLLALATQVYTIQKSFAALQAAMFTHGAIGTT